MSNPSRHVQIFLKDGFRVGSLHGDDVDTVLKAVEGHTKPSKIGFDQGGKPLEGDYMEITSTLRVALDANRAQHFHVGQVLVVIGAYNKENLH